MHGNKNLLGDTNKRLYPVRRDSSHTASGKGNSGMLGYALIGALKGFLSSAAAALVLLTLLCLIAFSDPDPEKLILPLSLLSLTCSALVGGAVSALAGAECPVLCGTLTGAFLTVALILAGAIFFGKGDVGLGLFVELALRASVALLPILGALFVSKLKEVETVARQRRRIHRRR